MTDIDTRARIDLTHAPPAAAIVAWHLDPLTREVTWSEGFDTVLGIPGDALRQQAGTLLVHPDDRAIVARAIDEALATWGSFHSVHRMLTTDGVRVVEAVGAVMGTGLTARLSGTLQDVTERLQAASPPLPLSATTREAIGLIGAVAWAWDLDAEEAFIEVFGDAPWSSGLLEGRMPESHFLAILDPEAQCSIKVCAQAMRGAGMLPVRLASPSGRHEVQLHWRTHTDADGRVVRLIGVALAGGIGSLT